MRQYRQYLLICVSCKFSDCQQDSELIFQTLSESEQES